MKNKINALIVSVVISSSMPAYAVNSEDLVDIHKSHWAYIPVIKILDDYQLMSGYPDHTFRGNKTVNYYELSVIALDFIHFLEKEHKISLRPSEKVLNSYQDISLKSIPENHWAYNAVNELKDKYRIVLFPFESEDFHGDQSIDRYELALAIDLIISMYPSNSEKDRNPYAKIARKISNIGKDKYEKSAKKLSEQEIMVGYGENNDFHGEEKVTRYQLAATLNNAIEYIQKVSIIN